MSARLALPTWRPRGRSGVVDLCRFVSPKGDLLLFACEKRSRQEKAHPGIRAAAEAAVPARRIVLGVGVMPHPCGTTPEPGVLPGSPLRSNLRAALLQGGRKTRGRDSSHPECVDVPIETEESLTQVSASKVLVSAANAFASGAPAGAPVRWPGAGDASPWMAKRAMRGRMPLQRGPEHVRRAGRRASARPRMPGCAFFGLPFFAQAKKGNSPLGETTLQTLPQPKRPHARRAGPDATGAQP
jgi:hypothetical protein